MAKRTGTTAPRLDAVRLIDLTDGEESALEAHGSIEGLRLTDLDLSHRDLAGITVSESLLTEVTAHQTDFRAASFLDTRIERLNAPIFLTPRARLRDVEIDGSRIGSADSYDANWQSVHVSHSKLGFVNLRGAVLQDVLFTDCAIDELDLADATATRVSFVNCTLNSLDVTRAKLTDVDLRSLELRRIAGLEHLRGATMTSFQVAELAAMFAEQFGIRVQD
ncbi:pentapeptide repeat-containing protein [Plantibacter flavus]|uniref:pentapeptide repeat-containing protein n=1 Tax=Plantibacter flavus TaxID=150123 RepID=UPI003F18807B